MTVDRFLWHTSWHTRAQAPDRAPAQVDVIHPADDLDPTVVVAVAEWPMTPVAARQLAAALNQAADQAEGR